MGVRFIGQPFGGGEQIGRALAEALRAQDAERLWIATAWAKQSGISRIRSAVTEFAGRGGRSEVVVGVDEGGATREGLELCLDLFDDVFVYHDPGARTFHPKLYAVEEADQAIVIVGSGNLTKGGLFTNYEAGLVIEAERGTADWDVRDDVRAYFDRLLAAGDAVRPLDAELIELLIAEGWVTSEARQNARRSERSRERQQRQQLFGGAVGGLAGAPQPDIPALPQDEEDEDSTFASAPAVEGSSGEPDATEEEEDSTAPTGIIGFWKQLSNSDASLGSSPGQIIIPIRYLDFFPPLADESALTEGTGSGQSASYFPVEFADGGYEKHVPQARVILYEPAPHHPRPNRELRFTFHDREILLRLNAGDVLVFTRDESGYRVERQPQGSMGPGRFGPLS